LYSFVTLPVPEKLAHASLELLQSKLLLLLCAKKEIIIIVLSHVGVTYRWGFGLDD
jgi:hypothetical protein